VIAISCPKCGKEYVFDETKIPRDVEMIECKICKTRFLLDWDEDLYVDPLEDLPAAEERLAAAASAASEPEAERPAEGVEPIEAGQNTPPGGDELTELPFEELDGEKEDAPTPVAEAVAPVRYREDRQAPSTTFSAERFRMLNARRKKRESKLFLYGLLALVAFLIFYFFIYSGH
jgi:transcription elongation factor Elf1